MGTWWKLRLSGNSRTLALLTLGACLITLAPAAHATDATVVCAGGVGIGFPSITAALNAIGQTGPSTITVTGTCTETVGIFSAQLVTIVAGPGGASIVGPLDFDAIDIANSYDISLVNLDIGGTFSNTGNGGGGGVNVSGSIGVVIRGCTIHDNQAVGVTVTNSMVLIRDTNIQNNIPLDGLDVIGSTATLLRTTIQNNGSPGGLLEGESPTNGGSGVFIARNSLVDFRQSNLVQNNADAGIIARLGSTLVFDGPTSTATTIRGHNLVGIFIAAGGHLQVNSPIIVQGNGGGACPPDTSCGAIVGTETSTLHLGAGTITGNRGDGISVEQGTDVRLGGATISNNTGDGVRIRRFSIGDFSIPGRGNNTITGNGGASIFCDGRSLAIGNLSGFSNVKCGQE